MAQKVLDSLFRHKINIKKILKKKQLAPGQLKKEMKTKTELVQSMA